MGSSSHHVPIPAGAPHHHAHHRHHAHSSPEDALLDWFASASTHKQNHFLTSLVGLMTRNNVRHVQRMIHARTRPCLALVPQKSSYPSTSDSSEIEFVDGFESLLTTSPLIHSPPLTAGGLYSAARHSPITSSSLPSNASPPHAQDILSTKPWLNLDPFIDLPPELMINIFLHLGLSSPLSLLGCKRVCKRWQRIFEVDQHSLLSRCSSQHQLDSVTAQHVPKWSNEYLWYHLCRSGLFGKGSLDVVLQTSQVSPTAKSYGSVWSRLFQSFVRTELNWRKGIYQLSALEAHDALCLAIGDDKIIGSRNQGTTLLVWNWKSKEPEEVRLFESDLGPVASACWLDKHSLIIGHVSGALASLDLRTDVLGSPFSGHSGEVSCVRANVLPSQNHVLGSGSEDGFVRLWITPQIKGPAFILCPGEANDVATALDTHPVTCLALANTPNGGLTVVSGSFDSYLRVWSIPVVTNLNPTNNAPRRYSPIHVTRAHDGSIYCLESRNGNEFVSGGEDKTIFVWSFDTPSEMSNQAASSHVGLARVQTLRGHKAGVISLQFDASKIISGAGDGEIRVWDRMLGVTLFSLDPSHSPGASLALGRRGLLPPVRQSTASVWGMHLAGSQLVSVSLDKRLFLWDFGCES